MVNWLPNSWFKGFNKPKLILEEYNNQPYGGYYMLGTSEIVVVQNSCEKHLAHIIAHECVHYMQYTINNLTPNNYGLELFSKFPYNIATRLYYKTNPRELEALELAHKYSPSHTSKFWLKACVLPATCNANTIE